RARTTTPQQRTRELARIHQAKKQLGLDEDTYRAVLERVTGQRSAADLSAAGRAAVLAEFERLGFAPPRRGPFPGRPKNTDAVPMLGKVEALLADAK
ncbi:regulatory protein GemA, partial [Acinetobacter baumannii]